MATSTMEIKNAANIIVRALAAVAGPENILPRWIQDLNPNERPSPPTSPLQEVVVLDPGFFTEAIAAATAGAAHVAKLKPTPPPSTEGARAPHITEAVGFPVYR